ncbi:MAG: hypothetical protein PHD09_07435 [Candidatus Omnitrophica bacterium]|nr:hypothetical protein [Candidatus Omnitrophota bacterium]
MISIDFSVAIAAYTILLLGIILISWIAGKKQKDKELSLDSKFIWFCSICSYTYVNTRDEAISLCPRCGSYNKK